MAVKQVMVSDISGTEVPDDQHVRLVVNDHPRLPGSPVELDISAEEAGQLKESTFDLVTVTVYEPNKAPRKMVFDATSFGKQFGNVDIAKIIEGGRKVQDDQPRQRRARGTAPKTDRIDYTARENFGLIHRGKVTEAEATLVRDNLEQANANRKREGQPEIDPKDATEKKRYGFK